MRYQVHRGEDGWYLFAPVFHVEALFHAYATRRQAITAVQMMRFEMEQRGLSLLLHEDE